MYKELENEMMNEKRTRANLALVQNLHDLIEKNPNMRFGQILFNFGFVSETTYGSWKDEFFAEPEKTLERVESRRRQERVGPGISELGNDFGI